MLQLRRVVPVPFLILLASAPVGTLGTSVSQNPPVREPLRVEAAYAHLPLSFEANQGQADPSVRFFARGTGYEVFLTNPGPVFTLGPALAPGVLGPGPAGSAVRMELPGSWQSPQIAGRSPLPGTVSYFEGDDPDRWHTDIPTYGSVEYRDVYPGVDLVFAGTREAVEYDFVLAPGADPKDIALRFRGAESLRLDPSGDLVIDTAAGEFVHRAPIVYQDLAGERRAISGGYVLDRGFVGFEVGPFDHDLPLVIDPVVVTYSTFIGGAESDEAYDVAVDGSGAMFVTGRTRDHATMDFPTTVGAFDTVHNGLDDVFVAKLNPAGTALVYSTYLGGTGQDIGHGIAVDGSGAAYVAGNATAGFPTTPGGHDTTHNGGTNDVFVTKLAPAGDDLDYSTFLGGSGGEGAADIALDGSGAAYITGGAGPGYPATPGGFDIFPDGAADAYMTKIIPDESGTTDLAYSTFLGGDGVDSGQGIAVDGSGTAYVTGWGADGTTTEFPTTTGAFQETNNGGDDAFVTKIIPDESGLTDMVYSTLIGGAAEDQGHGIAIDGTGTAYVTGHSYDDPTTDFPTTGGSFDTTHNGSSDVFATKVDPTGGALGYSTFIGGSGLEIGQGIAPDGVGAAHLTGFTADGSFPTTVGAFDETYNGGGDDAFVTKLAPSGAGPLVYSTFLGGGSTDFGEAIAVDGSGTAHVVGRTSDDASDLPTTPGAYDVDHNGGSDAFLAKLVETPAPVTPAPPSPTPPAPTGTCKGKTATVTGTSGNDTLTGTSGPDVVAALGGNDQVSALGGNDVVCAGDGNDTANGGGGKDQLLGEDGNDKLKGGGANDKIKGGKGNDTCTGGSGDKDKAGCEKEKSVP